MKNWIYKNLNEKKWSIKKTIARIALVALLVNIVAPGLTYAAAPDFASTLVQGNILPMAQVNKIVLPRTLVSGDLLELTISGTTVSQVFDTDTLTTANLFNVRIDILPEVISAYDDSTKTFTLTSANPGIAFSIGDLQITRTSISPTTPTPNVVAVAQVGEISIPQQLFAGDTLNFLIDGVSVVENFSGSTSTTLSIFADKITSLTSAGGSYDSGSGKIIMAAKVAGTSFSMSNLIVYSNGININNITPNTVPVAQVEEITIPRIIYSDETISVTINGSGISQAYNTSSAQTLSDFNDKINNLPDVNASLVGSVITVTSANPGIAFTISDTDISNGTINGINVTPNQIAIAQEDIISVPRDLYLGDTINFSVGGASFTQGFNSTSSNTMLLLIGQINALSNVFVSAYSPILRAITIKSTAAGTAFASPSLHLSSNITSSNITASVPSQRQVGEYTLNRALTTGDNISAIVNGSPINVNFSGSSVDTINSFIGEINSSMSGVINASLTGSLGIHLDAVTSGIGFTAQPLTVSNSLIPTVLVANVTPVKQKETLSIPNDIIAGDTISLNLGGATVNTGITQVFDTDESTTLTNLRNQINSLGDFSASLVGKNLAIEASIAGNAINVSNFKTTGISFSSATNTGNVSETKANITLDIDGVPSNGGDITVGQCVISFSTGAYDLNCNNNTANIFPTGQDNESLASVMSLISNIKDNTPEGLRNVSGTASGTQVVYITSNNEISTQNIYFNNNLMPLYFVHSQTNGILAQAQIDTISLPRNIVSGDSVEVIIDGITVTQNFLSSSAISFNNLVTQINNLPNISATSSGSDIIVTADTAGTGFNVSSVQYTNSTNSTTSISNVQAVAQKSEITFPAAFVTGDIITVGIDGTTITENYNTNSNTTLSNLISSITSSTNVNASLTGSLGMILEAKVAGTPFVIDSIEINNTITINNIAINIPGVAQVNEIVVPFTPANSDEISVNINGTVLSETGSSDPVTKLSLLNTKIDNLASVNSSFDGNSTFTITSANAGTAFTAGLSSLGATLTSSGIQTNINSGAQVDTLTVNRNLIPGDSLILDMSGTILTQNYTTDKATTLGLLNTQIDNLTDVNSIFDGTETITITANEAGIPFTAGILNIYSTIPSINQVANVPAVRQIDRVNLPRTLMTGDSLSINIDGHSISPVAFSGSNDTTLASFVTAINNSQSGVVASNNSSSITLSAAIDGIPFTASGFLVENTSLSNTTTNNVTAVKQVSEFDIPLFVAGDNISFTINGSGINQTFNTDNTTTINSLIGKIDALGIVVGTYLSNSGIIRIESSTAGVAFTLSQVSIINTTPTTEFTANVVPVAQVVHMTPGGTLREGLTFRVTINSTDYDYLTTPSDTVDNIINSLSSTISNTGVVVSSGSDIGGNYLTVTSSVAGVAFSYNSQVLDITAPIITMPINTAQTLKTGDVSTSNVEINEDGTIYLVLSGTTINNVLDLTTAEANHIAFVGKNNALSHSLYTITVPTSIDDGAYNFVAVDDYNNVSQAIPGWLTVDNNAPVINITTQPITTNNANIVINGTTEANTPVTINGGSGVVNITSDGAGDFSGTVALNENIANTIIVSATDIAGNIGTGSVVITHDNLAPAPFTINHVQVTNNLTTDITVTTEPTILVSVYESGNLIHTGTTNGSGTIDFNLALTTNTINDFNIIATDAGLNESSSLISIIQDSINPGIILNPLPNSVHTGSINISGTTEPMSNITLDNSGVVVYGTSDGSGIFDINISLFANNGAQTANDIAITAVDPAGNIGTGSVSIIEDSIANSLIITTPSQYTNQSSITVSGSTKPNATIMINDGVTPVSTTADNNGLFSGTVDLHTNALNGLLITSTDSVGNIAIGNIDITQDNINPTVVINTPTHPTNSLVINIFGTTEALNTITITGGSGSFNGVSDGSGIYSIPVELNSGVMNNLVVSSTDQAGNIGTGSISILQDQVVVFINHNSPSLSYTNNSTYSFSGTTKPNAQVAVTGGSGALILSADGSGTFVGTVDLNFNTSNTINLVATDDTTSTANTSFTVIHDNVNPTLQFDYLGNITNQNDLIVTGITDSGAFVSINNGGIHHNATASSTGSFTILLPMNQNLVNNISGTATDLAGNISSSTGFSITHDNVAPVLSNLTVSSTIVGASMNINYLFDTNENSDSVFYIGSSSNVLANLIMSGTTTGINHSRVIPGFTPNTTYYYFVSSTDGAGNTSQTPISTVNFIDNTGPAIISKAVNNITITGATLDFSYSDAHFNSGTLAAGTINLSDGVNSQIIIPSLNYANATNTGSANFLSLSGGTDYSYIINLTDDFGNISSATGAFTTTTDLVLSGSNMTETGSVYLNNGTGGTADMSGTTLTINSDSNSGLGTGSIVIPGIVDIVYGSGWNFILSAPSLLNAGSSLNASDGEVSGLISSLNTSTITYSPSIIQTISAGGNVGLTASGGNFSVNVSLSSSQIGQILRIYRSQDGINWTSNIPDDQCTVTAANTCTFETNHFTLFTFVKPVGTAVTHSSGGGGSGISRDYCPAGDNSSSYYDGTCGVATVVTNTNTTTTATGTINNPIIPDNITNINTTNIDQLANKYILKIKNDNYSIIGTVSQKIDLWKKTISKIDAELSKSSTNISKIDLLNAIKVKAKYNLDKLVAETEADNKSITGTDSTEQYTPSVETQTDKNGNITTYKFIDVDNSVVARNAPSYKGEIMNYLPRNFKVELLEYGTLWSKIRYNGGTISYIRTKYLRDENREDRGRKASMMAFFDTTLQADIDLRQIKVAHSVNVRRGPSVDDAVKTTLYDGNRVIVLDSTKVEGWYEVKWNGGHGWINSSYVEQIKK